MINIQIDIGDVADQYNLLIDQSKILSNQILDRLLEEYMVRWQSLVSNELGKTKSEYLSAMEVDRPNDYTAIIRLTTRNSNLPLMIEDGAGPYDIKEGLSKSAKKKSALGGGWYIDVPFRFATSSALGASAAFTGGVAPASVISAARKAKGQAVPTAKLPKQFQASGQRDKITNKGFTIPAYQHKVSIYSGIRRTEAGTGKKKSGVYNTFRRVSDNSDSNSWIHKGFTARKFMERTLQSLEVGNIVDSELDKFLNTL